MASSLLGRVLGPKTNLPIGNMPPIQGSVPGVVPSGGGGFGGGYVGPAGSGVSPVAINPGITINTGPAPNYADLLANDPWLKQQFEWIDEEYAANVMSIGGSGGSNKAALKAAQEQAALAKEGLLHEHGLALQMIQQLAASRGVLDSGVPISSTTEENWQFEMANREIDLALKAAMASASGGGGGGRAGAMAQAAVAQKRARGEAAFEATERLRGTSAQPSTMAFYVPEADAYQSPDGRWWGASGQPLQGRPATANVPGTSTVQPRPTASRSALIPYIGR